MFHGQILCKEVSWDLDADGESLDVENKKEIIGELVNQEIAKADLDTLKKLKEFQCYKQVEDVEQILISCTCILWKKGDETWVLLAARCLEASEKKQPLSINNLEEYQIHYFKSEVDKVKMNVKPNAKLKVVSMVVNPHPQAKNQWESQNLKFPNPNHLHIV